MLEYLSKLIQHLSSDSSDTSHITDEEDREVLLHANKSDMKHASSTTVLDLGGHHGLDWRASVQSPLTYRLGNSTIRFQKPLVAAMGVIFFALVVLVYMAASGSPSHSVNYDDHYHKDSKG